MNERQAKATNLSSSIRHAVLDAPMGDTRDDVAQARAMGRDKGPNDNKYPVEQEDEEAFSRVFIRSRSHGPRLIQMRWGKVR